MSAPSKSAIAVVRAWPRRASLTRDADGNLGFALRLLVGFIATLAVVELVGFVIIDRNARSSQIAQYSAMQQSDVRIFETIGRRSLTTASALIKIDAVLDVLAKRPGTLEAKVFDEHGGILASGDPGVIGTIDTDPRIANVIRTGDAYAGHEGNPNLDQRRLWNVLTWAFAVAGDGKVETEQGTVTAAELAAAEMPPGWKA